MRAGRLDRRIEIQENSPASSSVGQKKENWSELYNVWAEVVPMRGMERFAADQNVGVADTKFKIRYIPNFSSLYRIVYENRIYDITQVLELGRREGLEIMAKTRSE